MMSAYICKSIYDAEYLVKLADISGSLSLDALAGLQRHFADKLHKARPHKGQITSAKESENAA